MMSHSRLRVYRVCLVALLLLIPLLPFKRLASSPPALTLLDFEDLTPSVDLIQNQYLGTYGVAFDAGRIIVPDAGSSSGRQALRASGFQAEFHQDPLIIHFSSGQSYVGMRVGLVQATAAPVRAVLRAYDTNGAPIGTPDTAMIGPGPTPINTLLEITDATDIREVRLHYENTFLFEVIDDLTSNHMEALTPESNAPIVQIWSPSHNGIVLSPHFQLVGTIEEESALADVRLSIGQPGAAATSFQIQVTGGPPVSNIYGLDSGVLYGQLAEGSNTVKVRATDIHGNSGEDAVTVIYERLAPPPATIDLYPTGIEVTQGIQDKVAKLYNSPNNAPLGYGGAVPLVAGKSTVVRLYGTAAQTAGTVNGVPAELWGYQAESGALLPGSPLQPANGTISLTPGESVEAQRARLDGAWIFEVPPAWTQAGAIRLLATVNPGQNVEECPTCYNTGNRLNLPYLAFEPMPDLHIYPFWACVRRDPAHPPDRCDLVNPFAPLTLLLDHDSVLPAVLPTAHMDIHLSANPIIYMDGDFSLGGNMTSSRVSAFLGALAYRRYQDQVGGVYRCINSVGGQSWIGCFTVAENHLYLGLMPPPVNETVGLGRVDASAAVAVFDPGFVDNHSAVIAEELSHAIEFAWHAPHTAHPNCTVNPPGWPNASYPQYVDPTGVPYPRASIGQWGFDPRPPYTGASLHDPAAAFDYMSYCNPSWVSPYTYRLLYNTLRTGFTLDHDYTPFQELFPFSTTAASAAAVYMLVMGEIDADDTVRLQPFNRFTLPAVEMNDPGSGAYQLQVRSSPGAVLFERRFAAEVALVGVTEGETGFFAELVPFPVGAVEIRIVRDGKTLAQRTASAHAPQVQLLAPLGGEEWPASGKVSIRWSGSDADGDTIFYTIQYSLDNGISWQTVAADLTTDRVDIDLAWLAGADQARVRVLASDGMHTGIAQTASPLRVANKPPVAAILAPEDGATLLAGQPVTVRGLATDREDGPLPAESLTWLLDGVEAGQGDTLALTHLAVGAHQLTLRAADSKSLDATASMTFTLTQPGFAVTFEELAVETVCGGATHTLHVGWRTSGGSGGVTVERITVSSYEMDTVTVEGPLASAGTTSLQIYLDGGGSATVGIRARDGSGRIATALQTVAAGHYLATGLAVDHSPLDFASVAVGMSQTLTFSLRNVGSAPIALTGADGLAQPFAFASAPTWPLTLQPGAKTAIAVRFAPTTAGVASSLLRIRQGEASLSLPVLGEGRSAPPPPLLLFLPYLRR